jgi:hypothetical protein
MAETTAGRISLAATTRHLVWLSELHADHRAALECAVEERAVTDTP